jgi:hypothetical protein
VLSVAFGDWGGNHSAEDLRSWHGLYKAALFETDASKLAIAHRRSPASTGLSHPEAFVPSPSYDGESEAIKNASYALKGLKNCLRCKTKDRRHAYRNT